MAILILNGPNLNCLQWRSREIYKVSEYGQLAEEIVSFAKTLGLEVELIQSNSEGEIIDYLQRWQNYQALIINPGAFAHYSFALRDALEMVRILKIEVHLSNIFQREDFRQRLVTAGQCDGVIAGFGRESYFLALQLVRDKIDSRNSKKTVHGK